MVREDLGEIEELAAPASRYMYAAATRCIPASARRSTCAALEPAQPGSYAMRTCSTARRAAPEQLEARLRELLATVQQPHLRELLERVLAQDSRAVGRLPGRAGRQALPPGLPARSARALPERRPGGQRDLRHVPEGSTATSRSPARCCTTSASSTPTPTIRSAIDLTDVGRLHGEIALGYYRVRRDDRGDRRLPAELAQALLHIILSHHGTLEHGSPVVPCTREATLVHMIDNLGGRLGSFDRLEKELRAGSAGRQFDRALGGGAFFARAARAPRRARARSGLSRPRVASRNRRREIPERPSRCGTGASDELAAPRGSIFGLRWPRTPRS